MARGVLLTANLPQLQNLIKRDPTGYKEEFLQQWNHYNSIRQIFQINPDEQAQHFRELVSFISQASLDLAIIHNHANIIPLIGCTMLSQRDSKFSVSPFHTATGKLRNIDTRNAKNTGTKSGHVTEQERHLFHRVRPNFSFPIFFH
jgi:hypothetical protein